MWDLHNTNYTFLRVDPGRRVPCKENEGGLPQASPSPRHRIFSPTVSPSGWSTSRQIPAPQTPNGISSYLASSSLPSHVGRELAFCAAPECGCLPAAPRHSHFPRLQREKLCQECVFVAAHLVLGSSCASSPGELQGPRIAGSLA